MSEEAAGLNRHRLEKNKRANRLFARSLESTYLCFVNGDTVIRSEYVWTDNGSQHPALQYYSYYP